MSSARARAAAARSRRAVSRAVASTPSMRGMRMSIRTTSGRSCRARSIASAPSPPRRRPRGRPASPGTAGSPSARAPGRRRSAAGCSRVTTDRQARRDAEAAAHPAPGLELASEQGDPLAHSDEAVPTASRCALVTLLGRGARAVVPSSTTSTSRREPRNASVTVTRVGCECLSTLVSASWTMR